MWCRSLALSALFCLQGIGTKGGCGEGWAIIIYFRGI
jgi:hypothetical protein